MEKSYITSREQFRKWLDENGKKEAQCWVCVKRGKPVDNETFWYLDAVEEALCFGWIDSTQKCIDGVILQKFTPRKRKSPWTELNKERVRRLEKLGLMTDAGRAVLPPMGKRSFQVDKDIEAALKKARVWTKFKTFHPLYQRVRAYNVAYYKSRDYEQYQKALDRLIRETKNGRMYGQWNDYGRLLDYGGDNMETLKLYHTGAEEIKEPDVNYGRRNADFGGGFYLSDSLEFASKWAGTNAKYINYYTLDLDELNVKRFDHSEEWFEYISKNRLGIKDSMAQYDVIIGPIANDTLYDTYGIITSGLLKSEDAIKLLKVGKKYYQINVKTEKAASKLKWEKSVILNDDEIKKSKEAVRKESEEFTEAFSKALSELDDFKEIDEMLS